MTILSFAGHNIDVADVSEAGVAYLLQYGFAKSLQDSIAGRKKAFMAGDPEKNVEPMDEDEATAKCEEIMAARVKAIIAGEVGTRSGTGGAQMTKLERTMRAVAADAIKAAAKAAGKKLPKGDAYQTLVTKYIAKYEEKVREEAEARLAGVAELADSDVLEELGL